MVKKAIIIILIIIILVGFYILFTNNFDLTKKQGSADFIKSYSGWIVRVAENSANIAGYVVKLDWLPK